MAARPALAKPIRLRLQQARVARLATVGRDARPHLVPVCFAFNGRTFYLALDRKPKRRSLDQLLRVRNLKANPRTSLQHIFELLMLMDTQICTQILPLRKDHRFR